MVLPSASTIGRRDLVAAASHLHLALVLDRPRARAGAEDHEHEAVRIQHVHKHRLAALQLRTTGNSLPRDYLLLGDLVIRRGHDFIDVVAF